MDRRRFLRAAGSAASLTIAGLAGCSGGPEEGGGAGTGTATGTEIPGGATTTAAEQTTTAAEETTTAAEETTTAGTGAGTAETTAGGGATNEIRMVTDGSDYYFDPIGLYVEPGESITWVNESGAHSSTAYAESLDAADTTRIPEGAEPWNSETISESGATFSHTFETTGTYDYFCIPHKSLGMVGRLVVGEPGGVEGDPPDGDVPSPQAIVERRAIGWQEFSG